MKSVSVIAIILSIIACATAATAATPATPEEPQPKLAEPGDRDRATSKTKTVRRNLRSRNLLRLHYCDHPSDYQCYEDGWAPCCFSSNYVNKCPRTQPQCDKEKCKTKRRYTPVYQEVTACAPLGKCATDCIPIKGQSGEMCVSVCN